jgi:hypothetical protein
MLIIFGHWLDFYQMIIFKPLWKKNLNYFAFGKNMCKKIFLKD